MTRKKIDDFKANSIFEYWHYGGYNYRQIGDKLNISPHTVRAYILANRKGYRLPWKYQEALVNKHGEGIYNYHRRRERERRKEDKNVAFRSFLRENLDEMDMSVGELSEISGINYWMLEKYVEGSHIPREGTFNKLMECFGFCFRNIDELLAYLRMGELKTTPIS